MIYRLMQFSLFSLAFVATSAGTAQGQQPHYQGGLADRPAGAYPAYPIMPTTYSPTSAAAQLLPEAAEPLEFQVSRRGTATVEDAYRLFLNLAVAQRRLESPASAEEMPFDEVTSTLCGLKLISPRWGFSANTCLRRDILAYMAARYLCYRPGLLTGIFGMTPRYAHREMQFRKITAGGPPATLVSGSELLSVVTRVASIGSPDDEPRLTPDEIH